MQAIEHGDARIGGDIGIAVGAEGDPVDLVGWQPVIGADGGGFVCVENPQSVPAAAPHLAQGIEDSWNVLIWREFRPAFICRVKLICAALKELHKNQFSIRRRDYVPVLGKAWRF